jgi:hypothetical protein
VFIMGDGKRIAWLRGMTILFIVGLVVSGATAIPVQTQVDWLMDWTGLRGASVDAYAPGSWQAWLLRIDQGVSQMNREHAFLGYAGDWLAYGHFAIAIVFFWAIREPIKYRFLYDFGLVICLLVIPYALVAGYFRGIPLWWRGIDCSFGVLGAIPMLLCRKWATDFASADNALE